MGTGDSSAAHGNAAMSGKGPSRGVEELPRHDDACCLLVVPRGRSYGQVSAASHAEEACSGGKMMPVTACQLLGRSSGCTTVISIAFRRRVRQGE